MTRIALLVLGMGCTPIRISEQVEDVDVFVRHESYTSRSQTWDLSTQVALDDTVATLTQSIARSCSDHMDEVVDRTVVTTRSFVEPPRGVVRGWGWLSASSFAAAGGTAGLAVAQPGPFEEPALQYSALGLSGAAATVGTALLIRYATAHTRARPTREHLGEVVVPVRPKTYTCDEAVISAGHTVTALGAVQEVDEQGRWTLALDDLDDETLRGIATAGLPLKVVGDRIQFEGAFRDVRLERAADDLYQARIQVAREKATAALPGLLSSYKGKWKLLHQQSQGSPRTNVFAVRLATSKIVVWPKQKERPELHLRCQDGRLGAFVVLHVDTEAERHGYATNKITVEVSFDGGEAQTMVLEKATGGDGIFFEDADALIDEILAHREMSFSFVPVRTDKTTTSFSLTGFEQPAEALRMACAW